MTQDQQLSEINRKLERLCALFNGPQGVFARIEVHEERLRNIPTSATLKWHAFLGGGVVTLFGIIGFSISRFFK